DGMSVPSWRIVEPRRDAAAAGLLEQPLCHLVMAVNTGAYGLAVRTQRPALVRHEAPRTIQVHCFGYDVVCKVTLRGQLADKGGERAVRTRELFEYRKVIVPFQPSKPGGQRRRGSRSRVLARLALKLGQLARPVGDRERRRRRGQVR